MLLTHLSLVIASSLPLGPMEPAAAWAFSSGPQAGKGGCVCGVPPPIVGVPKPGLPEKLSVAPGPPALAPRGASAIPKAGSVGLAGPTPGPTVTGPCIRTYDPLGWDHWWRLERDGFIKLRDTVRRRHVVGTVGLSAIARADLPPSRALVDAAVVPALIDVLENESSPEMLRSALIAVARIGAGQRVGSADAELALARHLASSSQEVSETAALALGIFGGESCFASLEALLSGSDAGVALVGRGKVPSRTQAFAAFGMGALAFDAGNVNLTQRAAAALVETLMADHAVSDVPVAAMLALSQCPLPKLVTLPRGKIRTAEAREAVISSTGMLRWLLARLNAQHSDGQISSLQEHAFCLTAVAHFARDADEGLRGEVLNRLRAEAGNRKLASQIRSSAVIALGELARSSGSKADRAALQMLTDFMDSGQPLERRMAAMALAQASARAGLGDDPLAASDPAGRALQRMLLRGGSTERPWGALALGVQAFYLDQGVQGVRLASAKEIQQRGEMRRALAKQKNVSTIGAYALGVALMHKNAEPGARLSAGKVAFEAYQRIGEPKARGYLAMALGLTGYGPAKDTLLQDVTASVSQPSLLWHTAVGLGLIGDVRLAPTLIEALIAAPSHGSRAAIAVALGTIGDRRAVVPLLGLVADKSHPTASRSMAIVGIGILCENSALPWRNPMAHALPYAALTDTLGGDGNPIFDIL